MNLNPSKFYNFAALLLPVCCAIVYPIEGSWFSCGVLFSGMFLLGNLYLWTRIIGHLFHHAALGASMRGLSALLFMKLLVLGSCLLLGSLFFPIMSIALGNSIVALSVLVPSLYVSIVSLSSSSCQ